MKYILSVFLLLFGFNLYAAPKLDLALCIDSSGSVSSTDFQLQLNGTASSVGDPTIVPQDGSVRISVIQFGSSISVEVPPTVITAANAASVATTIRNIVKGGGGTNMSGCINTATTTLTSAAPAATRQVIDISTDGQPNSQANTNTAAAAAKAAGIDAINALLVGSGTNPTFMGNLVFPQPNGGKNGFSIVINSFANYKTEIARKIKAEVKPPVISSQPIPTLSEWGLIFLVLMLIFASVKSSGISLRR